MRLVNKVNTIGEMIIVKRCEKVAEYRIIIIIIIIIIIMAGLIGWPRQKTHSFEKAVVCYLSIFWFTCFLVSSSRFLYSTLQIKVPRNPLAKNDFSRTTKYLVQPPTE